MIVIGPIFNESDWSTLKRSCQNDPATECKLTWPYVHAELIGVLYLKRIFSNEGSAAETATEVVSQRQLCAPSANDGLAALQEGSFTELGVFWRVISQSAHAALLS